MISNCGSDATSAHRWLTSTLHSFPGGSRYTLKLSSDPRSLRYWVPPHPNFFSAAHHLAMMRAAHVCSTGCTITRTPGTGLKPAFEHGQDQSSLLKCPFPRRPTYLHFAIGSNGVCTPSARCHRTSPTRGIRRREAKRRVIGDHPTGNDKAGGFGAPPAAWRQRGDGGPL